MLKKNTFKTFAKAIRIHQWAKNILIFVPLITAHKVRESHLIIDSLLAFLSFSLIASATYVLNDLVDIESDRLHPKKKNRPLASGAMSPSTAKLLIPALLVASITMGFFLPRQFLMILVLYFISTIAYSFNLKKLPLVDVIILAGLYTTRLFAGAVAVKVPISFWLLAFSMFFFLSLALVKRYSELQLLSIEHSEFGKGRGYMGKDLGLIGDLGVASGYLSVLVMALYVNSPSIVALYKHPPVLWGLCPILLFWISRVWLITRRGLMHEDPIVFAIKDRVSYLVALLTVSLLILGTLK